MGCTYDPYLFFSGHIGSLGSSGLGFLIENPLHPGISTCLLYWDEQEDGVTKYN